MISAIKVIREEKLYDGFYKLTRYDIQVPSFHDNTCSLVIRREILSCYDSVMVLIYAASLDSFVFVQQFRNGVFAHPQSDDPFIFECVAGMIDSSLSPEDIARKEVFEETGIQVKSLQKIALTYKSPGMITEKCHLYLAAITAMPNVGIYGVEDEEIKTHVIPRKQTYKMMDDMQIVDSETLLALNWFRANHRE